MGTNSVNHSWDASHLTLDLRHTLQGSPTLAPFAPPTIANLTQAPFAPRAIAISYSGSLRPACGEKGRG